MNGNSNVWRRETVRWRSCRRRRSISKDKIYTPVYLHVKRGVRIAEIQRLQNQVIEKKNHLQRVIATETMIFNSFFQNYLYIFFFLFIASSTCKSDLQKGKKTQSFSIERSPNFSPSSPSEINLSKKESIHNFSYNSALRRKAKFRNRSDATFY